MKRMEKYNYARELLEQQNIELTNNRPTFNNFGDIVFHSHQLMNVIIIKPQATKKTIKNIIEQQINLIINLSK